MGEKLQVLRSVIYLLTQMAKNDSNAGEMLQMRYPVYFLPFLKSANVTPELKSLILSYYAELVKQFGTEFLVKNEVTSLLILELKNV